MIACAMFCQLWLRLILFVFGFALGMVKYNLIGAF